MLRISGGEWDDLWRAPILVSELAEQAGGLLIVDVDRPLTATGGGLVPFVAVAAVHDVRLGADALDAFDIVLADDDDIAVEQVVDSVGRHPQAALVAAQVIRASLQLDLASALAVESAAYSMLQAGPEFASWLAGRSPHTPPSPERDAVSVGRDGDELRIVFDRPHVHNAFNRAMRDGLVEALELAATDPTLRHVVLTGAGPSFCSGGDVTEFGTAPDPATAHVIRSTRSAAWAVARVAAKLRVELHGACVGAGIELAAWAADLVAADDTFIELPEVGLGLIPGAGGTASVPRRIGRQRATCLAVTGARLDAVTALRWGLVDRLSGSTRRR